MVEPPLYLRRFSCRRFHNDAVEESELAFILEAARWAPSAGNLQPWRFFVVRDPSTREALALSAYRQKFVSSHAPVVIVVCAVAEESARHYGTRGASLYCLQDTAAAVENILLAATELGLGSCWVGAFDETAAARALDLPDGWRPVAMIPIGRPAEGAPARARRPLREVTLWR